MSGSMYKLLPDVLMNLSKISATVQIAIQGYDDELKLEANRIISDMDLINIDLKELNKVDVQG